MQMIWDRRMKFFFALFLSPETLFLLHSKNFSCFMGFLLRFYNSRTFICRILERFCGYISSIKSINYEYVMNWRGSSSWKKAGIKTWHLKGNNRARTQNLVQNFSTNTGGATEFAILRNSNELYWKCDTPRTICTMTARVHAYKNRLCTIRIGWVMKF